MTSRDFLSPKKVQTMQILPASSSSPNTVSELEGTSESLNLTHFREGGLGRAQSEAVTDATLVK